MDLKEELENIIELKVHGGDEYSCYEVRINGVGKAAQAIIDYLPEFILLEEGAEPQEGDVVILEDGTCKEVVEGDLSSSHHITVMELMQRIVVNGEWFEIHKRNGLPVLIKKGE